MVLPARGTLFCEAYPRRSLFFAKHKAAAHSTWRSYLRRAVSNVNLTFKLKFLSYHFNSLNIYMSLQESDEQWILRKLYQANRTDVDTYRVFLTLRRYIHDPREFYGVVEQINPETLRFKPNTDIADDCFFSVSLFSGYIRRKARRHGAPGVGFYSHMGQAAFDRIGYPGIANNWKFWTAYVQEHFVI